MKKTQRSFNSTLSRSTPMKSGGAIRKKRKAKGSASWCRDKVYRKVMDTFIGKPCVVCAKTEGTCGHHIIPKGVCPYHRANPKMIIPLCSMHHIWAHGGRLHSSDPFVVGDWLDWLEANYPARHAWAKAHRADTSSKLPKHNWITEWEEMA